MWIFVQERKSSMAIGVHTVLRNRQVKKVSSGSENSGHSIKLKFELSSLSVRTYFYTGIKCNPE